MAPPGAANRCPLCGETNDCGLAAGRESCWCFDTKMAPEVLEQIPAEARGRECVCQRCAGARATTARKLRLTDSTSRR